MAKDWLYMVVGVVLAGFLIYIALLIVSSLNPPAYLGK